MNVAAVDGPTTGATDVPDGEMIIGLPAVLSTLCLVGGVIGGCVTAGDSIAAPFDTTLSGIAAFVAGCPIIDGNGA